MKPQRKYLDELTPRTRYYFVKVVVVDKYRVVTPTDKSKYQRLLLRDEKGNNMDATVFSDDIDIFKDNIQKNGEYEIRNASISTTSFPGRASDYQMAISARNHVSRLDSGASSSQSAAVYRPIGSIPHNPYTDEHFDLVVIVLYVSPAKTVIGGSGYPSNVSELIVMDDSTEVTLIISLWSDLADNEAIKLAAEVDNTPVISLCDLHASKYHGFSLASSKSTLISLDPVGDRPTALRDWKTTHAAIIEACKLRVQEARWNNVTPEKSTIKKMIDTNAGNVAYGKNIRLKIFIPEFTKRNLTMFVGCRLCGKKCDHENGDTFVCDFCSRMSAGEHRIFFNFNATDGSGSKILSSYNEVAEKMLQVKLEDILQMNQEEMASFYEKTAVRFRTMPTCIELAPVPPPAANINFIKWVVKEVITE